MKEWIGTTCLALALVASGCQQPSSSGPSSSLPSTESVDSTAIATAFDNRSRNVEVEGTGAIAAILPDDLEGSRHQRFLVRLDSGQTVLIVHNIDLAPRVTSLRKGDRISFRGEYVWNPKGGLVHWTHRDPSGQHSPGWVSHDGEVFR